ncbi:hypothetical protein [Xanthomonas campestris]|uniref:hypothetical protein n=1 Tax=Xanthomonas campestris TaxID=339 RepID=UPI0012907519|nr:hypothetical protein [Xanthomonas campestris]
MQMFGSQINREQQRHRMLLTGASLLFLALILIELLINTFNRGTCCFDDASFAVLAKNLAAGEGYLLSLDYSNLNHQGSLFHPALGTGPSTIVWGAAAIRIFGNAPWIPGMALIAFNAALTCLSAVLISRKSGHARASAFTAMFTVLAISITTMHHEQWFAFLGELQSYLLAFTAFVIAAYCHPRTSTFLVAGILLGASFEAKELSAIYVIPLGSMALYVAIRSSAVKPRSPQETRRWLTLLATAAIGTLLPIALFELYRWQALGSSGWLANWIEHTNFIRTQGTGSASSTFDQLIQARAATFKERFNIGVGWLLAWGAFSAALTLWSTQDAKVRSLTSLLVMAFFLHLGYWIFFSNGWPRYSFNAVLYGCALICMPILYVKRGELPIPALLSIITWCALVHSSITGYIVDIWLPTVRSVSSTTVTEAQKQLEVQNFLASYSGIIYAPWWAHIASQEYLGAGHGRFTAITPATLNDKGLLLIDRHLPLPDSDDYIRLSKRCTTLKLFYRRYEILSCRAE